MKINMPVTQQEILLDDASMMVSRTDLKGQITFANAEFIEVSGFTEEELLGSSHNIVRHPDMPPEAFADLWTTVKAGKPWTGIVKNRAKNGDHYWVEANVTPIVVNGETTGYVSVRQKPTRQQIEQAQEAYGHLGEMSKFEKLTASLKVCSNNLKIRTRLISSVVIAVITTLAISMMALSSLSDSKQSVNSLYEDRVVSLKQLKLVADMYAVNIVDTSHKVRNGAMSWADGIRNVEIAKNNVDKEWTTYLSTGMVPEELALIEQAKPLFEQANTTTEHLLSILKAQDQKALEQFTAKELYPGIDPLSDQITALIMLQLKVSSQINDTTKQDYAKAQAFTVVVGLLGILLISYIGRRIYLAVIPRVQAISDRLLKAAKEGDTHPIEGFHENDELAELVKSYRALQIRTQYDHVETINGINLIKSALDAATIPVSVGDKTNKLIYLNQAGLQLWELMGKQLGKDFPGFDHKNLLGTRLGQYIKNEQDRAAYVNNTTQNAVLTTVVGGRTLELTFNPVFDEHHKYVGRMIQWLDRTNEVDAEAKIQHLIESTISGNLSQRIDLQGIPEGFIKDTGNGINQLLEAVIEPLNTAATYVEQLSKGNIPPQLTRNYQGDFKKIEDNLNACGNAIKHLIADINAVSGAANQGQLSYRANPDSYSGDYKKVIAGVNQTLDAVVSPLNVAARIVESIAHGDIPPAITDDYKGDFNQIKNNLNTCITAINALVNDAQALAQAAAAGEVTQRADIAKHQGDFKQIISGVNNTLDLIVKPIANVKRAVETITTAAEEISSGNNDLSARTEQQAANLEETASSMEQLASTVKVNADNAKQANHLALEATNVAIKGGEMVSQVVQTMHTINESSKKIEDIITLIDGIAFQTNILALNAAVEAARAGEQGRGFAVVAGEVRSLAQRSASAAKEIKELIHASVEQTTEGSTLVENAGQTMDDIVHSIQKVSQIISDIASASLEQSSGIDQVNVAITSMDETTQQNAALVEEAAAAAESLKDQANNLLESVNFFKLEDVSRGRKTPPARSSRSLMAVS